MRKIVFEISELELIAIYERPTRIETIQYIWERRNGKLAIKHYASKLA